MTGIFDTHCHLFDKAFADDDNFEVLSEAKLAGVGGILNVGYSLSTSMEAIETVTAESNNAVNLFAAVGIHPTEVSTCDSHTISQLENLIRSGVVFGIGEIGLDYYRSKVSHELQKEWLRKFCLLAKKYSLPVLLHIRGEERGISKDAFDDAYEIIKETGVVGICHCFTGDLETAEKFIELGFYISFGGNITFKNSTELQKVATKIPLKNIVVETDAPYLSPAPLRGQVNYPDRIVFTVRKLASLRKLPVNTIISVTTENALRILKIPNN